MTDISSQLKEHLEGGKDWERMDTPVPGLFVVKVPATKTRKARLNLELSPLKNDGTPLKKKSLFIGGEEMFIKYSEMFSNDKAYQIIREIEQINKKQMIIKPTKKLEM